MSRLRDAREATTRVSELRAEHEQIMAQTESAQTRLVEVRLDLASAQTRARAAAASAVDHATRARADLERHDAGCPCRGAADAEITQTSDLSWPSGEPDDVAAQLAGADAGSGTDIERMAAEMELRVLAHDRLASAIDTWHSAEQRRDQAEHRARDAGATLAELLDQEGFTTSDEVEQHLRSRADRERLAADLDEQSRARTAAQTVLADPDILATVGEPLPDQESLRAAAESAQSAARSARELASALERARGTLLSAARDLSSALEELRPLRARHEALGGLAAVLNAERGAAGDRRMRLSAYVLAARLEEVVRLANERLGTMTDQRFTLEHDDGPGSRGSRGGLGLRVHDAWTGTQRSTRSLSGGETFLASLALALALGDAIQQDAGGRQLETLFVDEGFGSLDEDSLELVLEVLDELRSGGRTVGIVSHVAELRQRIPAQIEVIKAETGSSVRVHLPGRTSAA